jgi:RNA polymerase sigma-70 factor (ECF subfamily)
VHDLHQLAYEEGIESEKDAMQKVLDDAIEFSEIQKRLSNLDVKYQEVIALRFFEEKSLREIAAILNKKDGTIKSLLSRGLKKLKIAIENG